MKLDFAKILVSQTVLFGLFCNDAYASWPTFAVPNLSILESNGLLDKSGCSGTGVKLISNVAINIKKNLCRTFCSTDWEWIATGDNQCHELNSEFDVIDYNIQYVPDANGTNYSVVTAIYGNRHTHTESFRFILTTQENQYWYCSVANAELGLITCANDI